MPTRSQTLTTILKQHGGSIDELARAINKGHHLDIAEAEFVGMVGAHARRDYPDLTDAAAFSKRYEAATSEGLELRKAIGRLKGFAV